MRVELKNFKRRAWVGIGIIAGSMIIFGIGFYVLTGDISQQAALVTQSHDAVASQSALINSYSNLKKNAPAAATYQVAMDRLLGGQDDLIAFPSQVGGIARNDGVELTFSFVGDPVPPSGTNTVGYVGFKLNATGSLSGISAFLKDMELSAPILLSRIDSFDLTQSGSGYVLTASGRAFFN